MIAIVRAAFLFLTKIFLLFVNSIVKFVLEALKLFSDAAETPQRAGLSSSSSIPLLAVLVVALATGRAALIQCEQRIADQNKAREAAASELPLDTVSTRLDSV